MDTVEVKRESAPFTEGKTLPNGYIATEYQPVKIENNSTVQVVNINSCAKCNSHASESCGETSDVASVCSQLANINIDITNNFGIIIISHNGQFNLDVQPNNTIEEVKSKIQSKEGISLAEQRLYYDGKHLRDDRTLTSCKVEHGSSVELVLRLRGGGFQVFIKVLSGQTRTLVVKYETTVWELKEKIAQCEGIPLDQQRLIFGGSQLEDHRTLAYYDICEDSTVHLTLRLKGGNESHRSTCCKCIIL